MLKDMITLRPAVPEDAAKLVEIYKPYILQTAVTYEYEVPSEEAFAGRIARTLDRGYPYLIAEQNGRIIGYAYAGSYGVRAAFQHTTELSVYLDMEKKGQGAGRMLYEAIEEALRKKDFHCLVAVIAAPDEEPDPYLTRDSLKFHKAMGYKKAGELHQCGYKFGPWYNIVHMEKLIQQI